MIARMSYDGDVVPIAGELLHFVVQFGDERADHIVGEVYPARGEFGLFRLGQPVEAQHESVTGPQAVRIVGDFDIFKVAILSEQACIPALDPAQTVELAGRILVGDMDGSRRGVPVHRTVSPGDANTEPITRSEDLHRLDPAHPLTPESSDVPCGIKRQVSAPSSTPSTSAPSTTPPARCGVETMILVCAAGPNIRVVA